MAADFNKPAVTDNYSTGYTPAIVDNLVALAKALDPAVVTPTNLPTNTVRWNSVNRYWEKYNGTSWAALENSYAINISGTAAGLSATLAVNKGGTGAVSFTSGGLLVGNGTSAVGIATAAQIVAAIGSTAVANAGAAPWSGITSKPTTVSGFGVTDAKAQGKETIWIPAGAMTPRLTNGPAIGLVETTTNKIMLSSLDFDQTTLEYAQFQIRMPKSWNESTLTAVFDWSSNIAGTNAVVWGLQAVAISNDDALDTAFGSAVTVTDAQTAQGDLMKADESSAMTVGGTPIAGDLVTFQVYRDAANGSDTLAGDARLHGVTLFYTTDAANDA